MLTINGMPTCVADKLEVLMRELMTTVALKLRLSEGEVSVFFPVDLVQSCLGEELICFVDDLFEKLGRTPFLRTQLVHAIMSRLRDFAMANLPQCEKVKVIVNRFNQESDGFAVWEREKKS